MADNPKLRGADRHTVSSQPYEINHLISALQKEFPQKSRDEIHRAVDSAKDASGASEARETVTGHARAILRK